VVERGFTFLKDPLFLASSVFVKRPERIMALAFVMTLCLLVYKLVEVRVRQRLAETGQTVPDHEGACSPRQVPSRARGRAQAPRIPEGHSPLHRDNRPFSLFKQ
jgi:peptidoglycan/LPS O-acetylase OafA/YrhL